MRVYEVVLSSAELGTYRCIKLSGTLKLCHRENPQQKPQLVFLSNGERPCSGLMSQTTHQLSQRYIL